MAQSDKSYKSNKSSSGSNLGNDFENVLKSEGIIERIVANFGIDIVGKNINDIKDNNSYFFNNKRNKVLDVNIKNVRQLYATIYVKIKNEDNHIKILSQAAQNISLPIIINKDNYIKHLITATDHQEEFDFHGYVIVDSADSSFKMNNQEEVALFHKSALIYQNNNTLSYEEKSNEKNENDDDNDNDNDKGNYYLRLEKSWGAKRLSSTEINESVMDSTIKSIKDRQKKKRESQSNENKQEEKKKRESQSNENKQEKKKRGESQSNENKQKKQKRGESQLNENRQEKSLDIKKFYIIGEYTYKGKKESKYNQARIFEKLLQCERKILTLYLRFMDQREKNLKQPNFLEFIFPLLFIVINFDIKLEDFFKIANALIKPINRNQTPALPALAKYISEGGCIILLKAQLYIDVNQALLFSIDDSRRDLQQKITELSSTIKSCEKIIDTEKAQHELLKQQFNNINKENLNLRKEKEKLDQQINTNNAQIKEKDNKIKEKDNKIKEKDNQIKEKDNQMEEKDNQIKALEIENSQANAKIISLSYNIENLKSELTSKDYEIKALQLRLKNLDTDYELQKAYIDHFQKQPSTSINPVDKKEN